MDQGASVEVMYEHCFEYLHPSIKSKLKETNTPLVGFVGESIKLLGKIELDMCFGNEGFFHRTTMKFVVVRSPSPYNIILGRSGIKKMRAIPSTIHSMVKFPTPRGIATLVTQIVIILECLKLEEKQMSEKETKAEEPQVAETTEELVRTTEEVLVHPAYPDQLVTIRGNFSKECRRQLITLLKNNQNVFTWEPTDMTGVPRRITEHKLNVNIQDRPVAQKKRSFYEEKNQAIKNKWPDD